MKTQGWVLALVLWAGFAAAAQAGTYVVTASTLNVRSGPGTGYSIIGTLSYGTVVNVTEASGGWSHISSPKTGWVSSTYLQAAATGTSCRWAGIRDASFEYWARAQGFSDGNAAIRSYYDQQLAWLTQNTDAKAVSLTTYATLWSSPPSGSTAENALINADAYNGFEETGRFYFKIAFSGNNYDHAGVASPTSGGRADVRNAVVNTYDCGSLRWRSAAMHEATHLLRDDGFHHTFGASNWCIMDNYDIWNVSSPAKSICPTCITRVNQVQ